MMKKQIRGRKIIKFRDDINGMSCINSSKNLQVNQIPPKS